MSLLHSSTPPLLTFTERRPAAYKVLKRGQVFIILNLQINDAGKYSCVATNKANQTIQWPPGAGFFVLSRGKLEKKLIKCRISPAFGCLSQSARDIISSFKPKEERV